MPVLIEQTFPLGRFHATRWNQSPFEDNVGEWPPSPWRLLRALAARWFQYQRETGDEDIKLRDELLRALAGELPSFRLPVQTWRGRDIRQYQPTALEVQYKYKTNQTKALDYSFRQVSTTLAIDTYRAVPRKASLYWIWRSCALSAEASKLLNHLVLRVHYFGRVETWTTMRLVTLKNIEPNCELRANMSSDSTPVLAHCPDQTLDIDLMLASTDDKRLLGRRTPPGTKWFHAEVPACPKPPVSPPVSRRQPRIQVVRYALDSTVLPLVTETLPVAEAARRTLMGIYGWLTAKDGVRGLSSVLSGKDADNQPLADHRHAHYLPTDEDGDGRLDHLTIFATSGFGPNERRALDRLRELRTDREEAAEYPLRLLLVGMGASHEYHPGPLRESNIWIPATPYLATRYAKTRGRDRIDIGSAEDRAVFLVENLRTQVAAVRPDLVDEAATMIIEPEWDENHAFKIAQRWRTIQFKRYRRKASDDGGRRLAGAFRLTFRHPVRGPIALGFSSHFGMGLFMPVNRP